MPTRIKSNEFEILLNESSNLSLDEINFFHKDSQIEISIQNIILNCYELDDNESPARYRLKQIDKLIPNYNENVSFKV